MAMNQPPVRVPEASPDLLERVLLRLDVEQRLRRVRQRLVGALCLGAGLLVSAIPAWHSFQVNIAQSGFSDFVGLGFHDFNLVAATWQDYLLSLVESLPLLSTTVLLVLLLGVLFAAKRVAEYSRTLMSGAEAPLSI